MAEVQGHALSNRDSQTLPRLLRKFTTTEPVAIRGSNIGTELTMMGKASPRHLTDR